MQYAGNGFAISVLHVAASREIAKPIAAQRNQRLSNAAEEAYVTQQLGQSDARANLRDFFEVDAKWIAFTALRELPAGKEAAQLTKFAEALGLNLTKPLSTTV